MTRGRKVLTVALVPVVALVTTVAVGYDHFRAAAFIVQAAGMSGLPSTVAALATDEVDTRDVEVPWRGGMLRGRLFNARESEAVPVLLVPGIHAGGIDEPRLEEFARDVASLGRAVVAVELPDLKAYAITPRATDMIEDAAVWLSTHSGLATDGRIGMMGISFAGGLSVVAAGRPALDGRVAFVLSFGGHGDLPRTLRYLCTGVQPDGSVLAPHDYGVAIILLGVADRVVPAAQAEPLRRTIRMFLQASHTDMFDRARAHIEFEQARAAAADLPDPARTMMGYVNDRDVARLGPILLPHAGEMGGDAALSPQRSPLPGAPVYLLHGSGDNVVPAVESSLLAGYLRERGVRVSQLTTPLITHAEVDRSAAARAFWDLTRFWASLLDEK